ncbi:MAG: ABC transporter ATP-binding protein [Elusimicrobiota bacterium]
MNTLEIRNLSLSANINSKKYNIVNNVSIKIEKGQTVAIVGESGSGKTLTALSIIKLLDKNIFIESGEIIFKGKNIAQLGENEIRKLRGKEISFVFQEPLTALNPVVNIQTQMIEVLIQHKLADKKNAINKARELLKTVGIPPDKIKMYPHNFSGGQRQRILIATSLLTDPSLIIADEPTTALDVVTQIEILNLLEKLKKEKELSVMLITHNFAIVSQYSDYVYVMYLGEIMEEGKTEDIIKNPRHPYTKSLIESIVKLEKKDTLKTIKGIMPSIFEMPRGCRFMTRCNFANEKCMKKPPSNKTESGFYSCWNV